MDRPSSGKPEPRPRRAKRRAAPRRRGFILHVAACLLILIAILVFAYHAFVRGDTHHTFRALDTLTADTVALSAMNIALKRLHELPADFDLAPGRPVDLALADDPLARELVEEFRRRHGRQGIPTFSGRVTVTERAAIPLRRGTGLTAPPDPEECAGHLLVEVEAEFRGVARRLRELRAFKRVNLLPPVHPHFTLFVRDAGGEGGDSFNVVENDDQGAVAGPPAPLFLDHGNPLVTPLEARGFVFLGSGEVILNLAQGESGCGESFHFTGDPTRIDLPGDGRIIVNRYAGFYGELKNESCVAGATKNWRSAWLKLYGDDAGRSLTLVLGDVRRAYLRFAALFAVRDGRIRFERLLPRVPPDGSGLPDPDDPAPVTVTDYGAYAAHMSDVVLTPYHVSFDFLYDLKMNLTPAALPPRWLETDDHLRALLGDGVAAYPCDGTRVTLASAAAGRYFTGDLAKHPAWPHLADRVGPAFASGSDLLARIAACGGTVGGIVRVAGPLDLTPLSELRGGGVILCDGDIRVGPLESDAPLTLVSRAGHLRVAGKLARVGLVALSGRLFSESPLEIAGTVAVERIRPAENRAGGWIRYPVEMNPRGAAYKSFRRLMISPAPAAAIAGYAK